MKWILLSSLSLVFSSQTHALTSQPWIRCAVEGGVCNLPALANVRFGSNGAFAMLYDKSGSIGCNTSAFGPAMSTSGNFCDYQLKSAPAPAPAPAPVVTYPVYPGCASPDKSYARTVTLDGNLGKTLQQYFVSGEAKPGDHIIVKGPQGDFKLSEYTSKYITATFSDPAKWVWIDSQGATFKSLHVRALSKFLITKPIVSNFPTPQYHNLVMFAGAKNIVLQDAQVYGVRDASNFSVNDWLTVAGAVYSDNSKCVSIHRNKITNVRHGISITTRAQVTADTSIKVLAQDNELRNISGDFMRPNGTDVTLKGNRAYDSYLSAADGDGNHDDFIQGFAYPWGIEYSNVQILDNYFQESTNPARKFNSSCQGISVFDGYYTKFRIKGNTILANSYHGISMYGGKDGIIENNTVVGTGNLFLWISVPKSKKGDLPHNVIVRNNVANRLSIDSALTPYVSWTNNYSVAVKDSAANFVKFDMLRGSYDVTPKSTSILYGKGVGSR